MTKLSNSNVMQCFSTYSKVTGYILKQNTMLINSYKIISNKLKSKENEILDDIT